MNTQTCCARRKRYRRRRGVTLLLFAIILVVLLTLAACVLELSRLRYVKSQLQSAADAGALAGASRLRMTSGELETDFYSVNGEGIQYVRSTVQSVVSANTVAHLGPNHVANFVVQENITNSINGDIVIGNYDSTGFTESLENCNAVRVIARFTAGHPNGLLPIWFKGFLSMDSTELKAVATACTERPTLLPFLIYQPQWEALMAGSGVDLFSVDPNTHAVSNGQDGILETRVFPNDWDGLTMPPGNFGWFDIGPGSNTATLIRQIDSGPSAAEMAFHGNKLAQGDFVSGTTGLRAGTEIGFIGGSVDGATYSGILGKPRLIALYDYAIGQGTNASFRITKFVMARVVFVDLSGKGYGIYVQPLTKKQDPNQVLLVE